MHGREVRGFIRADEPRFFEFANKSVETLLRAVERPLARVCLRPGPPVGIFSRADPAKRDRETLKFSGGTITARSVHPREEVNKRALRSNTAAQRRSSERATDVLVV